MQKKATAAAPAKPAQKAAKPGVPASGAQKGQPARAKVQSKAQPAKAAPARAKAGATATKAAPAATKTAGTGKAAPGKAAAAGTVAKTPAKPAKEVSKTVVTKKAEAPAVKKATAPKSKPKGDRAPFFAKQRELLLEERQQYISSAEALKAQADSLALEHEPGDVQFDEEGGEGGTANVDREIDLYLSAQARATVVEIDRALQKIEDGTYGVCEQCGDVIPDARLQALPYAALCVTCKSGGLSSRR